MCIECFTAWTQANSHLRPASLSLLPNTVFKPRSSLLLGLVAGGKATIILDLHRAQTVTEYNLKEHKYTELYVSMRGGRDLNSNGWWEHQGRGQWCRFAYVITPMGRGLHILMAPQGTNSACFIIKSSLATQDYWAHPKINRPLWCVCVQHASMYILGGLTGRVN